MNKTVINFNKTFIWITKHNKNIVLNILNNKFKDKYRNQIERQDREEFLIVFETNTSKNYLYIHDKVESDNFQDNIYFDEYAEITYNIENNNFEYVNEDEINKNPKYVDYWEKNNVKNENLSGFSHSSFHLNNSF